ncbi:MAG: hypothetical protein IKD58_02000 [Loktanella sp.]|nr:hypothetical protein [Loktanella sp.]
MKKGITDKQKFKLCHLAVKLKTDDLIGTLRYTKYLMLNDLDKSVRTLETSIIVRDELRNRIGTRRTEDLLDNITQSMIEDPEGTQYENIYHGLVGMFHQIRAKGINQVEHGISRRNSV